MCIHLPMTSVQSMERHRNCIHNGEEDRKGHGLMKLTFRRTTHNSDDWEVQDHGAGICSASGEGHVLYQDMVETWKGFYDFLKGGAQSSVIIRNMAFVDSNLHPAAYEPCELSLMNCGAIHFTRGRSCLSEDQTPQKELSFCGQDPGSPEEPHEMSIRAICLGDERSKHLFSSSGLQLVKDNLKGFHWN
ncbi:uncharacterized protein [Macaca nemestrina]|uniref:uncharacterized protein isoform X2 n=1 Tax=Macaca nemestrina TaxID=9545 RepID=UPI0039B90719